eukprot:TRINITY_DN21505_c0_g1_i1.p1 TRINITY_DN21505_c0_g1~~TRINITY_DN21505_c0_g1_i1.p1  ORF type:complete len:441 (+),score=56.81 TRINITY_DN21505_c0_g1_i1:139-1323(+)
MGVGNGGRYVITEKLNTSYSTNPTDLHRLSQGGFGTTWIGVDSETQNQVVVKKIKSNAKKEDLEREYRGCLRVQQLIRIGKENGHPGWRWICNCLEVDKKSRAIVMDYCGKPMKEANLEKVGEPEDVKRVLTSMTFDLISTLDLMLTVDHVAHVHHDIKRDNIVIASSSPDGLTREDPHAMMIDWGGSEDTVSVSDPVHICVHTQGYVPPEMARSPTKCWKEESPGSYDMFSLGVVLNRTCNDIAKSISDDSALSGLRELAGWMTFSEWDHRPSPINVLTAQIYFGERSRQFLLGTWASDSTVRSYRIRQQDSSLKLDVLKLGKKKGSVAIDNCFAGSKTCCSVNVKYKSSVMKKGILEVTICAKSLVRIEAVEKASFKAQYILQETTTFTRQD